MKRESSPVRVDSRHYRVIAQENWGLTNQQMEGMHVHHRVPRSRGGTNDPSNLYVCSPSFHAYVWHGEDSYFSLVKIAEEGGILGAIALKSKIQSVKESGLKWEPAQRRAQKMHQKHKGSVEYSNHQKIKAQRAAASKRKHWTREDYDLAWSEFLRGRSSGYLIAKALGEVSWKKYANMLDLLSLGYAYDQVIDADLFVKETARLKQSSIAHVLEAYQGG